MPTTLERERNSVSVITKQQTYHTNDVCVITLNINDISSSKISPTPNGVLRKMCKATNERINTTSNAVDQLQDDILIACGKIDCLGDEIVDIKQQQVYFDEIHFQIPRKMVRSSNAFTNTAEYITKSNHFEILKCDKEITDPKGDVNTSLREQIPTSSAPTNAK